MLSSDTITLTSHTVTLHYVSSYYHCTVIILSSHITQSSHDHHISSHYYPTPSHFITLLSYFMTLSSQLITLSWHSNDTLSHYHHTFMTHRHIIITQSFTLSSHIMTASSHFIINHRISSHHLIIIRHQHTINIFFTCSIASLKHKFPTFYQYFFSRLSTYYQHTINTHQHYEHIIKTLSAHY